MQSKVKAIEHRHRSVASIAAISQEPSSLNTELGADPGSFSWSAATRLRFGYLRLITPRMSQNLPYIDKVSLVGLRWAHRPGPRRGGIPRNAQSLGPKAPDASRHIGTSPTDQAPLMIRGFRRIGAAGRALTPTSLVERPLLLAALTALAFSTYYFPYSNQNAYFLHVVGRWGDHALLRSDSFYNTPAPDIFFTYLHSPVGYLSGLEALTTLMLYIIIFSIGLYGFYRFLTASFGVPLWFSASFLMILCNPAATMLLDKFGIAPAALLGGIANQSLFYPPPLYYQPSTIDCLYFTSLWLIAQSRFGPALVVSSFVALVHPIMLACSFFIYSALMVTLWRRATLKRLALWSAASLAIVLPVLVYHLLTNVGSSESDIALARHIMIDVRTPHETAIAEWFGYDDLVRIALLAIGLGLAVRRKVGDGIAIRMFVLFVLFSAVVSTVAFAAGNEALRLIQPWRASVVYLPILTIFACWMMAGRAASRLFMVPAVRLLAVSGMAASLLSPVVISHMLYRDNAERWRFYGELTELYESGGVFAHIPGSFSDVRLGGGVPVFVDLKTPAFTAEGLIEWDRRVRLLEAIDFSSCGETRTKMEEEGIRWFIFDGSLDQKPLADIARCQGAPVLKSGKFVVYRMDGQ
jgi:hypothetical protein